MQHCVIFAMVKLNVCTRTGRKWSASQAVEQAETRLRHSDIVGTPCEGRMGLRNTKQSQWKTAEPQERRVLVQQEIRDMEEESMKTKAVQMG